MRCGLKKGGAVRRLFKIRKVKMRSPLLLKIMVALPNRLLMTCDEYVA